MKSEKKIFPQYLHPINQFIPNIQASNQFSPQLNSPIFPFPQANLDNHFDTENVGGNSHNNNDNNHYRQNHHQDVSTNTNTNTNNNYNPSCNCANIQDFTSPTDVIDKKRYNIIAI